MTKHRFLLASTARHGVTRLGRRLGGCRPAIVGRSGWTAELGRVLARIGGSSRRRDVNSWSSIQLDSFHLVISFCCRCIVLAWRPVVSCGLPCHCRCFLPLPGRRLVAYNGLPASVAVHDASAALEVPPAATLCRTGLAGVGLTPKGCAPVQSCDARYLPCSDNATALWIRRHGGAQAEVFLMMASHKQDTTPRLRLPTLRARPSRQRCMTAEAASMVIRLVKCAAALPLDVDLQKLAGHHQACGGLERRRRGRSERQGTAASEASQSDMRTAHAARETAHLYSDEEVEDVDVALMMTHKAVSLVSLILHTHPAHLAPAVASCMAPAITSVITCPQFS